MAPEAQNGSPASHQAAILLLPPTAEVGDRTTDETAGGSTVSVALLLPPPAVAEIVTGVEAVTAVVVIVKLTDVAPAGTITLAGADADADEVWSVTVAPPAGAGPFRVAVFAVVALPPEMEVGDRTTAETATAVPEQHTHARTIRVRCNDIYFSIVIEIGSGHPRCVPGKVFPWLKRPITLARQNAECIVTFVPDCKIFVAITVEVCNR